MGTIITNPAYDLSQIKAAIKPLTRLDDTPLQSGDRFSHNSDGTNWYWDGSLWRSQEPEKIDGFVLQSNISSTTGGYPLPIQTKHNILIHRIQARFFAAGILGDSSFYGLALGDSTNYELEIKSADNGSTANAITKTSPDINLLVITNSNTSLNLSYRQYGVPIEIGSPSGFVFYSLALK